MRQRRTTVFLLALAALLGGLITGKALFFTLSYLLGLLLVVSFAWAWVSINWVHLSRNTRTRRTQVGRPLEEQFTLRNTSIIPKLWIEVRDFATLPHHRTSRVIDNLSSHKSYSWRIRTLCQERGRYRLGPIRLRAGDPFGLFLMEREWTATTNVVVYPMTVNIQQFPLPVGVLSGGDALRRRTHYVTTNAAGVRDYAPGDSFSRIHWPSTARRNRLIVKEFELDPLADIWLVPDMSVFGHIVPRSTTASSASDLDVLTAWKALKEYQLPESTEEYTVTITASLAQHFLRRDRAVGMLAYGQSNEIVQPDRGERQLNRILETLAVLRAQGQVPIDDVINAESHLFPRGTTVIVVTATTRTSWASAARQLMRRGLRVVTVLVNPESFGGTRSAIPVASLLQASGMDVHVVNSGDDLAATLSHTRLGAG
ncbi:MAG: DUF58 domain-containing protein [Anaerolineae bacterium]